MRQTGEALAEPVAIHFAAFFGKVCCLLHPIFRAVYTVDSVRWIAKGWVLETLSRGSHRSAFWLAFVGFLVLTFSIAGIGGAVTAGSVDSWYPTLTKPAINPPNWIFGPVWIALYLMMSIAAALVWAEAKEAERRRAITWFLIQLALNLSWSVLFFGLHEIALALGCLILLWLAIAVTLRCFWAINRAAATLLLPYLAWVGFAGLLNFLIWRLN